jgi:hypothetical protein
MGNLRSIILEQVTASHLETLQVSILSLYEGPQKIWTHLLEINFATSGGGKRVRWRGMTGV